MEHYIVSARKYRPDTFTTVVGQPSITSTLKNAIKSNHLAHAYLFCGPRGVGKTTSARIFAKTINCLNLTSDTEPCNQCESCISFGENRSYNIHELDAASNNSVEDIRSLVDKVRIPPQIGKYSVYIIDEVHMLSSQAFNAFLKTLEEPPAHAIFILATTEKQKIIPTILSRCQIYDFNRISISDIEKHLLEVAGKEQVSIEPEALNVIAQKADGAMRDALSIFDQVVSFCGEKVTYQDTITNLNVLDYDYYFKLTDGFVQGDVSGNLMIFNEILSKGFNAHHFIIGLSRHFRDLLISRDTVTLPLLEVGGEIKERYRKQAAQSSEDFLTAALILTSECDIQYKNSSNQRFLVELALIRCAQLTELLKKKTVNEAIATLVMLPIFDRVSLYESRAKEPSRPSNAITPDSGKKTPTLTIVSDSGTKTPPVSRMSDSERRSRYLHTENLSTPSITGMLSGKNLSEVAEPSASLLIEKGVARERPFDLQHLVKAWREFAETVDAAQLKSALSVRDPVLNGDLEIGYHLDNEVQHQRITMDLKPKLLAFLSRELHNEQIRLEFFVTENPQEVINKPYTNQEKFSVLLTKYPIVGMMRQRFGLDFE